MSSESPAHPHDEARLDAMHLAYTEYFEGKLGPAPLEEMRPNLTKILDLGCGSGAWAVQAAAQFPDAEILAVDRAKLPDRTFPSNMKFQIADLTKELEFDVGSFDVVHTRNVLLHVLNAPDILLRASRLVKPGGFLIIEEPDLVSFAETGGPATRAFMNKIKELLAGIGADVQIGSKVEGLIQALGEFEDVNVKMAALPLGGNGPDEALNNLGLGMKQSIKTASENLAKVYSDKGLTVEMTRAYNEEQERPDNKAAMDYYFVWARRRATA
ncbi:S-adenosyl-L-methionine-dependent methyltransferase [Favolaschia claudopus]|uniref:S-adenosyl-L-methionine-dependent methyltransferase n=1 Tax=Favolaschia claudopus TaxID=2862362 RepID=A0AAW0AEJ8_9AGAR